MHRSAFGFLFLSLVHLAGCAGGPAQHAPNAGLEALAKPAQDLRLSAKIDPTKPVSDAERGELARQAAADLGAALAAADAKVGTRSEAKPRSTPPAAVNSAPTPPAQAPEDSAPTFALSGQDRVDAPTPAPPPPAPAPVAPGPGAGDPVAELAARMAGLLREVGPARIADAAALAPIESLRPGAIASLDDPGSALAQGLASDDRATLLAARERVLANPGEASESLRQSLAKLSPGTALKIGKAALCTRVQGFGRFEPFAGDTFAAGRPLRMIVYCELDGFASRPAREGDPAQRSVPLVEQQSVELTQSLTLYHDPSGLQAWHRPAQKVIETSRNKRHDFYLTQQVDLPVTLTVGRYLLKVTVTDTTTGATDETTMPINVVVR